MKAKTMEINLFNQYGDLPFDAQTIINDIVNAFDTIVDSSKSASLILVTNHEIQKINNDYRHIDQPTDVISFEDGEDNYLGDIFISVDRMMSQAIEFDHSIQREFAFLICHGLLHLLGYDHLNPEEERVMFDKQDELLQLTPYTRRK